MRKRDSRRKLRIALVFAGVTCLTIAGGYFLTKPFMPDVSNEILPRIPDKITAKIMTPYWADKRFDKAEVDKQKIMLSKDGSEVIDNIKITYRGIANRSQFYMDVIVLQFDREMPFVHTINVARAKKGFRLAGKDFQLISARKHRVQLWHHLKRQY